MFIGDYFQLTCSVIHGDFPLNIYWLFNGQPITNELSISSEMSGKRSRFLSIESIEGKHAGNLTCYTENQAGNSSSTVELHVKGIIS